MMPFSSQSCHLLSISSLTESTRSTYSWHRLSGLFQLGQVVRKGCDCSASLAWRCEREQPVLSEPLLLVPRLGGLRAGGAHTCMHTEGQESHLPSQAWPQPRKYCMDTQVRSRKSFPGSHCKMKDACEAHVKFLCSGTVRNSLRSPSLFSQAFEA